MANSQKKILFAVRSDARSKNGGDYQMMLAFKDELSAQFDTEICYGIPNKAQLTGVSAVLCTNLDRPIEAQRTMRLCKRYSVPFLLYALHHPHAGIEAYLRLGTKGFKRRIAQLSGFDPQRYERLLWAVRGIATLLREGRYLPQMSVQAAQNELLREADALICSSTKEIDVITQDIAPPGRPFVVPHPADAPAVTSIDHVVGRIVVAGRIEARKNQLAVLEMAADMPDYNFIFVGAAVASEATYFADFSSRLEQLPNASYQAALPKDDFYPFIASAELVVNASFFEVTSLIDVYCITNGIPLVTTKHTYLQGVGCFRTFSPTHSAKGVAAIRDCITQIRSKGRQVSLVPQANAVTMSAIVRDLT